MKLLLRLLISPVLFVLTWAIFLVVITIHHIVDGMRNMELYRVFLGPIVVFILSPVLAAWSAYNYVRYGGDLISFPPMV